MGLREMFSRILIRIDTFSSTLNIERSVEPSSAVQIDIGMKILFSLITVFLIGCMQPGGGASGHSPPIEIELNKPLVFELKLSVWGAGSKNIEDRYEDVFFHFKTSETTQFVDIPMKLKSQMDSTGVFQCSVPGEHITSNTVIDYYFSCTFDGHRRQRYEDPLKIQ